MKKFSLLIALCLLLTIGGVYATWIYSGSQIDAHTEPFASKMGDKDHQGNAGAYTFTNNSLDFSIEPDTQETKKTTLVWGTGSVTLTFTPKGDILPDTLARALSATITVEQASDTLGTYGGQTIYAVDSTKTIVLDSNKWTTNIADDGSKYYTYQITKADVEGTVSVGSFRLPTETEYNNFYAAIQNVKFRLKVTPAAAPTPSN